MGAVFKKTTLSNGDTGYIRSVPADTPRHTANAPDLSSGRHLIIWKHTITPHPHRVEWVLSIVEDEWERSATYRIPHRRVCTRRRLKDAKEAGQFVLLNVWGISTFPPTYDCRICGKTREGRGHVLSQGTPKSKDSSSSKAMRSGVCCDECNLKWVLPLRMRGLHL